MFSWMRMAFRSGRSLRFPFIPASLEAIGEYTLAVHSIIVWHAANCSFWHSNLARNCVASKSTPVQNIRRFRQFVFLRQLKFLAYRRLFVANRFRICPLSQDLNFSESKEVLFWNARHFRLFPSLRLWKLFQIQPPVAVLHFRVCLSNQDLNFGESEKKPFCNVRQFRLFLSLRLFRLFQVHPFVAPLHFLVCPMNHVLDFGESKQLQSRIAHYLNLSVFPRRFRFCANCVFLSTAH
jgi:hypothetical protein